MENWPLAGRVEDGRGGLGHPASPRFPSPLIERSMRISRTTLSDWLHRTAHDVAHDRLRLSGGHRLRIAAELLPTSPGTSGVCRLSPITMPSPSSEAHQKLGSFPPPALPSLSSIDPALIVLSCGWDAPNWAGMRHVDMRKLPAAAQEERRRQVIGLRQSG